MKIRIDNQIYDIDERTLIAWYRVGPIPFGTYLLSDVLTGGQWKPIHEVQLDAENSEINASGQKDPHGQEFEKEKTFHAYQSRRPIITFLLIAVNTIIFILLDQFLGGSQEVRNLIRIGAYSYPLIIENREYWRLISNTFLHIGSFHFLLNMGILFILGNLLEGLYGRFRYVILYLVSAIGGSLASLLFVPVAIGAGASGAIFGLMGAIVALGLRYRNRLPFHRNRMFGMRLLPFIGLDVVLGFIVPNINIAAHLGGLSVGCAAGLVLPPAIYAREERESIIVRVVAVALVGLTIFSGYVTTQHFFDSPEIAEKRLNTALPPLPSRDNLLEYIQRTEKALSMREYSHDSYAILERLYWEALRNDSNNVFWVQKLRKFYERVLLEEPGSPIWNGRLWALYQMTAVELLDERAVLLDYIEVCERIRKDRGYHLGLHKNLENFYARGKTLNPQQVADWEEKLETLYREAISHHPEHATWYNNLAWRYVEQKSNSEQAVELAQEAVRQDPTSATILDTLAWAYLQGGQFHKSLRAFGTVLSDPVDAEENRAARESSWKGIVEWLQADLTSLQLEECAQTFHNLYDDLFLLFVDQPAERVKLRTAFEKFQEKRSIQ